MTVCLALFLLVKTNKTLADENQIDYRHEFYREDDGRMSIDTDSVFADVTLNSHVRLTGTYVEDAISGSTPTGAPPPSQWPYPAQSYYYQQAYSQLFQAAVNDPNNLILYQSGYFANYQAYTNYIAASNPQIPSQATNTAATSYHSLTNNPSIKSNRVPLTELHDHRRAFSLSVPLTFGINQFTPQFSYSKESDYLSYGASLNYAVQLNDKNTTLNFGWSHDTDSVRDDVMVWENKISNDFFVGVNQLLSPKSYVSFNLTYGTEYGYLSDPYRGVMAMENFLQTNPSDAALIAEKRPRHRDKVTFYTSYTQFITPLQGSLDLGYRFFHDSSEIFSHTVDLAWHQKLGRNLVLSPSFRYGFQTAADFYYVILPDFDNKPPFYSSDYRLSRWQSFSYAISLTYRIQKHISLDLSYTRYIMQGLDGVTSQSAYPSANIYSAGLRLWF